MLVVLARKTRQMQFALITSSSFGPQEQGRVH